MKLVIADALLWQPPYPVDFLMVDIWPRLADQRLRSDAQQIQRNVKAQQVALWG